MDSNFRRRVTSRLIGIIIGDRAGKGGQISYVDGITRDIQRALGVSSRTRDNTTLTIARISAGIL